MKHSKICINTNNFFIQKINLENIQPFCSLMTDALTFLIHQRVTKFLHSTKSKYHCIINIVVIIIVIIVIIVITIIMPSASLLVDSPSSSVVPVLTYKMSTSCCETWTSHQSIDRISSERVQPCPERCGISGQAISAFRQMRAW